MWDAYKIVEVEYVDMFNPKHHLIHKYKIRTTYTKAICRLASRLGDFLSAGRRKSWVGDRIWSRSRAGLHVYTKIKEYLLFGIIHKGVTRWHTGEVINH